MRYIYQHFTHLKSGSNITVKNVLQIYLYFQYAKRISKQWLFHEEAARYVGMCIDVIMVWHINRDVCWHLNQLYTGGYPGGDITFKTNFMLNIYIYPCSLDVPHYLDIKLHTAQPLVGSNNCFQTIAIYCTSSSISYHPIIIT